MTAIPAHSSTHPFGPPPYHVNHGCGTHRAPAPWINTDLVENDNTHPDILVTDYHPFGWCPPGSIGRLYLGHVLEHIPLDRVPEFLHDAYVHLAPGAPVLAVGPDTLRTLTAWHNGEVHRGLVESVMEHAAYPGTTDWPGALHHWNCHEARVVEALTLAGFADVTPLAAPPDGWPVVGWSASWQFAVSAVRP